MIQASNYLCLFSNEIRINSMARNSPRDTVSLPQNATFTPSLRLNIRCVISGTSDAVPLR